ncbi:L-histidine N(alpha)-methyltransferase [Hyphobacterium marinum]|uniref:L-histidine N(Alpha)-methyltransferase n=1 Tax=Hyphobacterium marinum TaxID=3116574 RepID=A0ABU7LVQ7_9PROT|nr:L-histidine N(alpha)-methyltransferase [Hyphobacterium sp. Y6023]MEE2565646.1 L-histidine N(alpha)-methyltransferase [Hyphobacterium sp. Y6023]
MTEARTAEGVSTDQLAFFSDLHPPSSDFRRDVLEGLAATPKTIPPKYFYDRRGSALFDDITDTPEYYVMRTELALLDRISDEIAKRAGPGAVVIEPGSGSSTKIDKLLGSLDDPAAYVGLDISKDHLLAACEDLSRRWPSLKIGAICADFTRHVDLHDMPIPEGRRLVFFPGSTIGNFEPDEARELLKGIRDWLRPEDGFLIGVDRVKPRGVLEAAYDDAGGVTADFNLNLLTRINRELDGTIDTAAFEHRSIWNDAKSRIEMHLVATRDMDFTVSEQAFTMTKGETIHTENSHKFTVASFQALARSAGLEPVADWSDDDSYFTLHWLECGAEAW